MQVASPASGVSVLSQRTNQADPDGLDVHLIVDNYPTHKHPKVKAWLAKHTRYHSHSTPTYSSWLNQMERWVGLNTQQAMRRGSFKMCANSSPASSAMSQVTISTTVDFSGPQRLIPFLRKWHGYVKLFLGPNTSSS